MGSKSMKRAAGVLVGIVSVGILLVGGLVYEVERRVKKLMTERSSVFSEAMHVGVWMLSREQVPMHMQPRSVIIEVMRLVAPGRLGDTAPPGGHISGLVAALLSEGKGPAGRHIDEALWAVAVSEAWAAKETSDYLLLHRRCRGGGTIEEMVLRETGLGIQKLGTLSNAVQVRLLLQCWRRAGVGNDRRIDETQMLETYVSLGMLTSDEALTLSR